MAWTTPRTWVTGEVVTAAYFNTNLRDNLNFLVGAAGAEVLTSETTTSTTYTDLATVGPAVTVTTGVSALALFSAEMGNSTANATLLSVAVSGATTLAASENYRAVDNTTSGVTGFNHKFFTGLTAGSNTFTLKYRVGGGTGTFLIRRVTVIPLP